MPIIRATEEISGSKYGVEKETDIAFKVIADHIRTVAFAIGDGAFLQMKVVAMFYAVYFVELFVMQNKLVLIVHLCMN